MAKRITTKKKVRRGKKLDNIILFWVVILIILGIIIVILYKQFLFLPNKTLGISTSCSTNQVGCYSLFLNPVFDSSSYIQYRGSSNNFIWNHTTTIQANRLLLVSISYDNNQLSSSRVLYNGTDLIKLKSQSCLSQTGSSCTNEVWYLLNPASGTFSLSVTTNGSSYAVVAAATTFYNVDQTNPFGGVQSTSNDSTTASVAFANTNAYQLVFDALSAGGIGGPYIPDSSQTQIYEANTNNAGGGSFKIPTTSETTMLWSINATNGGDNWSLIAVPINIPNNELPLAITITPTPVNVLVQPLVITPTPINVLVQPLIVSPTLPLGQQQLQNTTNNPILQPNIIQHESQIQLPTQIIMNSSPTLSITQSEKVQNNNNSNKNNLIYQEAQYTPIGIDVNFAKSNQPQTQKITFGTVINSINQNIKLLFVEVFINVQKLFNK